jgi:hypothetical protein
VLQSGLPIKQIKLSGRQNLPHVLIKLFEVLRWLQLTIPDISSITSLQKPANLSAFLIIITASFAPVTFLMALLFRLQRYANHVKRTPIYTMVNTINKPIIHPTPKREVDITEKIAANTKVITAVSILILNLMERLICDSILYPDFQ